MNPPVLDRYVEVGFDCLPLRTIPRRDVPLDASPKYRAFLERVLAAFDKHGAFNSYFLYRGFCRFRLLNHPTLGLLHFAFDGTLLTDPDDQRTRLVDLEIKLEQETCDWLTQPAVAWWETTVREAVRIEFDHFIAAGDLKKTEERLRKLHAAEDAAGGYLGMGL